MSVGEHIHNLRTRKNMSQGDLAEALGVSRQSVSKWETGGSVPELDKLVALGELFDVTLDQLVNGPASPSGAGDRSLPAAPGVNRHQRRPHRTAGVVLLCFGLFVTLFLFLLGGGLAGPLYALPFLLCGTVCLLARRRAALWCGWISYLCTDLYLRYATGITWPIVFQTIGYQPQWNYARLAIGWGQFFFLVLLLLGTLRSFGGVQAPKGPRTIPLIALGWGALVGVSCLQSAALGYLHSLPYTWALEKWFFLTRISGDWLGLALLALLLVVSRAAPRWKMGRRP